MTKQDDDDEGLLLGNYGSLVSDLSVLFSYHSFSPSLLNERESQIVESVAQELIF